MGMLCGTCGTYQPIKQNLTTHQGPTNLRAVDVIGYRLACGHDVYGEEAKEFQEYLRQADQELQLSIAKARKAHGEKCTKAFHAIRSKVTGARA